MHKLSSGLPPLLERLQPAPASGAPNHYLVSLRIVLGFAAILFGGLGLEALAALASGTDLTRFLLGHRDESLEMLGTVLICAALVLIRDRQRTS